MKENYGIAVLDSGIGGLSTLEEIKKLLPNENFIYLKDNKNIPYGDKKDKELLKITINNIERLIKSKVKMVVIACNTVTTKYLDILKDKYKDIIFIGTEPAIKLACNKKYKNILCLVTTLTATSEKLYKLIKENEKANQHITILPCPTLAETIEEQDQNKIKIVAYSTLSDYKDYNYDAVILGCTHYCHIKDIIQKIFSSSALIDNNYNVALEVKQTLKENNLLTTRKEKGTTTIIETKTSDK